MPRPTPEDAANGHNAAKHVRAEMIYDTAVIGGGASGIAAAITSAQHGARTVLIEAQPRIGRKLLSTGNGRCNISNRDINPDHYRTDCPERVKAVLDGIGQERVGSFFLDIGVPFSEDREGRLYPRGDTAAGVLDMLRFELERVGAVTVTDSRVSGLMCDGGLWKIEIKEKNSIYYAKTVIIACGSPASPQLGGCGDGDIIVSRTGVNVIKRRQSLCPLMCDSPVLRSLKGLRAKCRVELEVRGKCVRSEDGELQWGDGCLSGICVFQLSSSLPPGDMDSAYVNVDLLPETHSRQLAETLLSRRRRLGHLAMEDFLTGLLNKRVAHAVLKLAGVSPLSRRADTLTDGEIAIIADNIKHMSFKVTGFSGWKQCQSALGGIPLGIMDDGMAITGRPGLYACGEAVNCSGDCGGFNLHWAWCSGMTAGKSAAAYCVPHRKAHR